MSATKRTWANVKKGATVELAGREWVVTKIKPEGKKATVRLERKGRVSKGVVKLKDPVTIVTAKVGATKRDALQAPDGRQNRWATQKEHDKALGASLPPGDRHATKPPERPAGGKWEKPRGDAEKTLGKILGARLVGESKNEDAGYYVPPTDVSTVAAHLALFHGGIPESCHDDEGRMLEVHARQHLAALNGEGILAVNHWHEERRP